MLSIIPRDAETIEQNVDSLRYSKTLQEKKLEEDTILRGKDLVLIIAMTVNSTCLNWLYNVSTLEYY